MVELLRFNGAFPDETPFRLLVEPEELADFIGAEEIQLPAVYVLEHEALEQLLKDNPRLLDDLGWRPKGDKQHLALYFLNSPTAVALRARFNGSATLKNSVHKFLQTAKDAGESNLFFLSTTPEIYAKLRVDAPLVGASPLPVVERLLKRIPDQHMPSHLTNEVLGTSPQVRLNRKLIVCAANISEPHQYSVLILGETGTGKGLVARQIHEIRHPSGRHPFVAVNCAAIPEHLLEAELFGAVRGAATGITARPGKWKEAGTGTIFLDEIGDLPSHLQAKILHVLQDLRFTPVGGTKEQEVKATAGVIAATNRNLLRMIERGTFREDLYYRLNKFLIRTYPLRETPEDVEVLIHKFWGYKGRELTPAVIEALCNYRWPGNVRELKSVLNGLAEYYSHPKITIDDLRDYWEFLGYLGPDARVRRKTRTESGHLAILRQLHQSKEIVGSCQNAFDSAFRKRKNRITLEALHSSLSFHLVRMHDLCATPELFGSEMVYRKMQELLGRLHELGTVVVPQNDEDATRTFWKDCLATRLSVMMDAVQKQKELVLSEMYGARGPFAVK